MARETPSPAVAMPSAAAMRRLLTRWLTRPGWTPRWLRTALARPSSVPALTAVGSAPRAPRRWSRFARCRLASARRARPTTLPTPDQVARAAGPRRPDDDLPDARRRWSPKAYSCTDGLLVLPRDRAAGHARRRAVARRRRAPVRSTSTCRPGGCRLDSRARSRSAPRPPTAAPQIDALIAYISYVRRPAGAEPPTPPRATSRSGFHQFTLNCAGCHQMVGRGGLTSARYVPDLQQRHRRSRSPRQCAWGPT